MNKQNGTLLWVGYFLSSKNKQPSVSENLKRKLERCRYKVIHAYPFVNEYFRVLSQIIHLLTNAKNADIVAIDVFSGRSFIWAEACGMVCKVIGKPYICILHGGNLAEFSKKNRQRTLRLLKNATRIVSPSQFLLDNLSDLGIKMYLLPNAVDIDDYKFTLRDDVRPNLFWLRAFHQIYNPQMAVNVAHDLKEDFPYVKLNMAGPVKDTETFQDTIKLSEKFGLKDCISFPGLIRKENIVKCGDQYDIFINTTTKESFGIGVLEAAAMGMCIVTTDVGELQYIWEHEKDALLVPSNDYKAMADACRRILRDKKLAQKLSINARKKAERFDWKVILPQWCTLFESINIDKI